MKKAFIFFGYEKHAYDRIAPEIATRLNKEYEGLKVIKCNQKQIESVYEEYKSLVEEGYEIYLIDVTINHSVNKKYIFKQEITPAKKLGKKTVFKGIGILINLNSICTLTQFMANICSKEQENLVNELIEETYFEVKRLLGGK